MSGHPGWLLVGLGILLIVSGFGWMASTHIPWVGRLPGDIFYQGKNTQVYFPIVTCLILSAVLTLVFWLFGRMR